MNENNLTHFEKEDLDWNQFYVSRNRYWHHGVALHFFHHKGIKWQQWHEYAYNLCTQLGYMPNSGNANGGPFGESTYSMTYKGLARKLLKFNYQDLTTCHFSVLEPGTEDVSKSLIDTCMSFGIYDPNALQDVVRSECYFFLEESIKPFELGWVNELAANLQLYSGALYGYYFRHPEACTTETYISGRDKQSTTIEELRRQKKWEQKERETNRPFYAVKEEERTDEFKLEWLEKTSLINYMRDIYKVNFLSERYLQKAINSQGMTLEEWIKAGTAQSRGSLTELRPGFYSWYIESDDLVIQIRKELAPSGLVVCV